VENAGEDIIRTLVSWIGLQSLRLIRRHLSHPFVVFDDISPDRGIFFAQGRLSACFLNHRATVGNGSDRYAKNPLILNWTGFSPHPSKPSVLPPSPKGRLITSAEGSAHYMLYIV